MTRSITRRRFLINNCLINHCLNNSVLMNNFLIRSVASMTMTAHNQTQKQHGLRPVAEWRLHRPATGAYDSVSGRTDPIHSRAQELEWPAGPAGRALRLDGYSNWITRAAGEAPALDTGFTLELWVALETYPVSDAAFLNQHSGPTAGWFLGLDTLGRWGLSVAAGGTTGASWHECFAPHPFPKNVWVHVTATFDPANGMAITLNGAEQQRVPFAAPMRLVPAPDVDLVLGKHNHSATFDAEVFPTGVLNGLLAEVRIYAQPLDPDTIRSRYALATLQGAVGKPNFAVPRQRFAADVHRPAYHAMPAAAWTNEPHGILRWNGKYHLFFQQNANGPYWGQIHWGHLESPDLVVWRPRPPILAPEAGSDQRGCWSGTALEYKGTPSILYTGVDGIKARILLAQSGGDLVTWEKSRANPVIPGAPEGLDLMDFRDPYAWVEGDTVYAIVGTGIRDRGGAVLLYRSHDLLQWTFVKVLLTGELAVSGSFWEMPIFIPIGNRHLLIVCEMPGRASYWIGTWQNETFTPDHSAPKHLDLINHFLSPTPFIDRSGRITVIGIAPDLRNPREAWQAGWRHVYGLPRELTLGADGTLIQRPLAALRKLRGEHFRIVNLPLRTNSADLLDGISGDTLEIHAVFDTAGARRVGLRLRCSPDGEEETLLVVDLESRRIVVDRSRSSKNPGVNRHTDSGRFEAESGEPVEMHVFLDRSMIDVFMNGRDAFTSRIYPSRPDSKRLGIVCTGTATLKELNVWRIEPAQ
jgi:sucrose-6-phosphate hydrolase SacC (GH32 family)